MKRPAHSAGTTVQDIEPTYANLIALWTSGIRDYHSLLSDYLTANSIFVAAIVFLVGQGDGKDLFDLIVVVLCTFGLIMTMQMAVVLGRFSGQNALWEWYLRRIESRPEWSQEKLFTDLYRFRDLHEVIRDGKDEEFKPGWAVRRHKHWWARRDVIFPLFFGIVYALFLMWGVSRLV